VIRFSRSRPEPVVHRSTRRTPGRRGRSKNSTTDSKWSCTRRHASRITLARKPVCNPSRHIFSMTALRVCFICFGSGRRETPDRRRVCQVNQFELSGTRCGASSTTRKNHCQGYRPCVLGIDSPQRRGITTCLLNRSRQNSTQREFRRTGRNGWRGRIMCELSWRWTQNSQISAAQDSM
jgi:hypothetical protein